MHLEDLDEFFRRDADEQLMKSILSNTKRYVQLLAQVADSLIPNRRKIPNVEDDSSWMDNILINQRNENAQNQENNNEEDQNQLPRYLKNIFDIYILAGPGYKKKFTALRALKADRIGHLVQVRCTVVRTSEVKPLIQVATYVCDACGYEIYQPVSSQFYNPLVDCHSKPCLKNKTR